MQVNRKLLKKAKNLIKSKVKTDKNGQKYIKVKGKKVLIEDDISERKLILMILKLFLKRKAKRKNVTTQTKKKPVLLPSSGVGFNDPELMRKYLEQLNLRKKDEAEKMAKDLLKSNMKNDLPMIEGSTPNGKLVNNTERKESSKRSNVDFTKADDEEEREKQREIGRKQVEQEQKSMANQLDQAQLRQAEQEQELARKEEEIRRKTIEIEEKNNEYNNLYNNIESEADPEVKKQKAQKAFDDSIDNAEKRDLWDDQEKALNLIYNSREILEQFKQSKAAIEERTKQSNNFVSEFDSIDFNNPDSIIEVLQKVNGNHLQEIVGKKIDDISKKINDEREKIQNELDTDFNSIREKFGFDDVTFDDLYNKTGNNNRRNYVRKRFRIFRNNNLRILQ
jgi:hypothetical protein